MIGLFDSGLGGLTVLSRIRERLPAVDVVFFADQANVPYGDRTHAELLRLLRDNLALLNSHGVELIAMACNTSCAIAERYGWPDSRAPVLDLIASAAMAKPRSSDGAHAAGGGQFSARRFSLAPALLRAALLFG